MLRDDKTGGGGQRASRNVLGEPLEICSFKPMNGRSRFAQPHVALACCLN
jgi:hypothetical protein